MKSIQLHFLILVSVFLIGCGHGFEGEYTLDAGIGNGPAKETIEIGSNYLEGFGDRVEYDISVEEKGGEKYLLLKPVDPDEQEEVWYIVDKNTLQQKNDYFTVTLSKLD